MRITYRQLQIILNSLSDEQLSCDVTVEDSYEQECYPADLRVCDDNHDSLDSGHPVIYIGEIFDRITDEDLQLYIDSLQQ